MVNIQKAKNNTQLKQPHLTLIKYKGSNKFSIFYDNIYGYFKAIYSDVLRGKSSHKLRGKVSRKEKTIITSQLKYNTNHHFQNQQIKEKIKQTNQLKYNTINPQQNKTIREKTNQTIFKLYNVKNISQHPIIKLKKIITCKSNFGVEYPQQSKLIQDKLKENNISKYGVDHIVKLDSTKNKIKETCLQKYNSTNVFNSSIIRKQIVQTNLNNGLYYNYNKYGDYALNPECYKHFNYSKISNLWLESIENQLGYFLEREYHIKKTRFHADGFCSKTNTIYEFYGDIWHGNLQILSPQDLNPVSKKSYQDLFNKTMKREEVLKSFGYNIISIWENDFNKQIL